MDHWKQAFAKYWRAFKQVTKLGFPRRFPIIQFPNLPLIIGVAAGETSRLFSGTGHVFLLAISLLAMIVWAYEELTNGANWFRSLLGLTYLAITIARIIGK